MGLVDNHPATAYLKDIGKRLAAECEDDRFEFRLHVADQMEPNAFALPGGWIYFSRGILALANREDEVAGIMGHEMTHVTERHSAKQMARMRLPNLLMLPGRIVGGIVSDSLGNLINAPVSTLSGVTLAKYGRGHESESDEIGLELAARAGYEPSALADILVRLEKAVETITGEERKSSFFDSHPMTPTRAKDIRKRSKKATRSSRAPIAAYQAEFLKRLDGLIAGGNPANGVFLGNRFVHPDHGFSMLMPDGWTQTVTPRVGGAVKGEGEALVVIGVQGRGTDPSVPADAFKRRLEEEHGARPTEVRSVKIGDWTGKLFVLKDSTGGDPVSVFILWVAGNGLIYQAIAVAPESLRPVLRNSALSLRPATKAELEAVRALRLRVAVAKEGETIEALSARTGNAWKAKLTAVANDVEPGAKLTKGQLVKIAVFEPYEAR
jgi:predicted Zn-dependent protease